MSTRATLEANTSDATSGKRYAVTILDKQLSMTRAEAMDAICAIFRDVLGSGDVEVRQAHYEHAERAGYRRCCTESMAHVEQLGKSLPEQGRQVLRPVYEWLQRQREVRL